MNRNRVWIIDDDQSIRWVLERAFQRQEIDFDSFESADAAMEALTKNARSPDAILSDVRMNGMSGLELLEQLREHRDTAPPIICLLYTSPSPRDS